MKRHNKRMNPKKKRGEEEDKWGPIEGKKKKWWKNQKERK